MAESDLRFRIKYVSCQHTFDLYQTYPILREPLCRYFFFFFFFVSPVRYARDQLSLSANVNALSVM